MTELSKTLTTEQEAQLKDLCEAYKTCSLAVSKALHFSRPLEAGQVQLFLKAEAEATRVLAQIKQILGLDLPPS